MYYFVMLYQWRHSCVHTYNEIRVALCESQNNSGWFFLYCPRTAGHFWLQNFMKLVLFASNCWFMFTVNPFLVIKTEFPDCFLFYPSLYVIYTQRITIICVSLRYEEITLTPWLTQIGFMRISLTRNLKKFLSTFNTYYEIIIKWKYQ